MNGDVPSDGVREWCQLLGTVLAVDDHPSVLVASRRGMKSIGISVVTDSTVRCALRRVADPAIKTALLDCWLPGEDMGELVAELRSRRPDVWIIGQSGSPDAALTFARWGVGSFLPKPWTIRDFLGLVREVHLGVDETVSVLTT